MSNKLSQSEIDALVASLIAGGDTPQAQPSQTDTSGGAPADSPAAAGEAPFEEIVDLGPITQDEVEAATAAYQARKAGSSADAAQPAAAEPPALAVPTSAPAAPAPEAAAPPPAAQPPAAQPAAAHAKAPAAKPVRAIPALKGVLLDIELTVTVELGRARLSLGDILEMGPGSVITLNKLANAPLDVKINGLPAMTAEVLAIGEKYGIRIVQSNLKVQAAS